jgi:chorismate lyase
MITTWTPLTQVNKSLIPNHYLAWLEKPYALSKALRAICNNFSLDVIDQSLGVLTHDEAEILDSVEIPYCLIRQVFLKCDDEPFVYARVCVPHETLFRDRHAFESLGNKPIGETLLYNRKDVSRGEFEIKVSQLDNPAFRNVTFTNHRYNEIWGRRSLFNYGGSPLLISEFFFSEIPPYKNVEEAEQRGNQYFIEAYK